MQLTKEKQDLTRLSWSVNRNSLGIGGSFLKAYSELGGKKTYYKLSNFNKACGVIGHECVNELIVDRLLTILGIPHLSYQLIHADVSVDGRTHEVYLCTSEDFKAKSESLISSIFFSIHMSDALRTGTIRARKPLPIRRNFQILPLGTFSNGFQSVIIYLPT